MDRWSFGDPETAPCTKTRYIGIPAFKFPFPYLTDVADWSQPRFTGATLRSYLDAYGETDHSKPGCDRGVFRCGQGVFFFEIPRDSVAWMGFLEPLVGELARMTRFWADFKVRECLGCEDPPKLKLMSWRDGE
ncbi:hypothetical protein PABG_01956 [Paracoccidioides brasiliensis Pb03]|nr:hypothetical protein PABG_01956 [Paracoccidioides brasiliensis Pb03]